MGTIITAVLTILGMIFCCFFTSGVEWGTAGSIFEKKSNVEARKSAEVRGGRKQGA